MSVSARQSCKHKELDVDSYLKDFVFSHTGEACELHLLTDIQIRHSSRKGNTLLAVLWANVIQYEGNYPQSKYVYTQTYDEDTHGDVLVVQADKVHLMVYMGSGTLKITGKYVYEWFVDHFREMLDNYDPVFAARYEETLSRRKQEEARKRRQRRTDSVALAEAGGKCDVTKNPEQKEHRTATEEYLLLLTDRSVYNECHAKKILHEIKNIELELLRTSTPKNLWRDGELSGHVASLSQGGVRDGYNDVYKLWRSLLHAWFSDKTNHTRVYICSPSLDERCLADILDLYLPHCATADLAGILTQRKCSSGGGETGGVGGGGSGAGGGGRSGVGGGGRKSGSRPADSTNISNSFFQMKKRLLERYPAWAHSVIEFKVYRTLLYPSSKFNCRFVAGVRAGVAKVMVTSADFNMQHFVSGNLECVSVEDIGELQFMTDYIKPLIADAISLA